MREDVPMFLSRLPRFGWRRDNPPPPSRYLIPLQATDLVRQPDGVYPSAGLVERAASVFSGRDEPRFVLFTQAAALFPTVTQARDFYHKTMTALAVLLKQQQNPLFAEMNPRVANARIDGLGTARALHDPTEYNLHWDGYGNSPLRGLVYGPNQDVKGGKPMLCDFSQFMKDAFQARPADLGFSPMQDLRRKHYATLRDEYAITLDACDPDQDFPCLIFSDHPACDGPMHGVTPVIELSDAASRPLFSMETVDVDDVSLYESIDPESNGL